MKLASLRNGSRDGQLCVVSSCLTKFTPVDPICSSLQLALDNWQQVKPELEAISLQLNQNKVQGQRFVPTDFLAPLPRAYQWADGSAYVNHVELVRQARGVEMPESFWTDPLMYQGGSDNFLASTDDIVGDLSWGIDFEGELAVITEDVPMGVDPREAENKIALLMLVNDVSYRNLIPDELKKGFGFFQSKPACACSPVAVTPDELGPFWRQGRVHLPLRVKLNEQLMGEPEAGEDMVFSFLQLISHAAKTRTLTAGTIIGSGTVSNKSTERGVACIAEKRMREIINKGEAQTPFLVTGDRVQLEMFDDQGHSIFGPIDQQVLADV